MLSNALIPVLGFVAPSGTGKTQLLKALIIRLRAKGLRLGVIKHSHHDVQIDTPGKDSFELRQAGATQTLVAGKQRWALITELDEPAAEADLDALLRHLDQTALDLILVEGFKHVQFAKIEVYREAAYAQRPQQAPLCATDTDIIAVASDVPLATKNPVTVLDLNDSEQIARFILQHFSLPTTQ